MILTPVIPRTTWERLRWGVVDAWVVTRRHLTHWIRRPVQIVGGLLFPIISVLLFGYVFGSAMQVPGGGDYREFLMPGMFGQTMVFGIGVTMAAVITDKERGITTRFRSMPMARSGVVVGRSLSDMLNSVVDLVVLVLCGLLVGWQWRDGFGGVLAALGLLLLLRFAVIWVGIYIGLVLPNMESAAGIWGLLFPITMIANTFVAPQMMPGWLGTIADWNPLSATVGAARELFGNPGLGGDSWAANNPVLLAVIWPLVLVAIFLPLSVRKYRNLSR
ncbi:ABC transporter permease [Kibdelosporangium phytohabitans]|uniref:Transport permease protein n=1 Tax=Kibdelosporangium phytohabitans TaxID=860235 RepID=A0A0N9I1Q3_9PSEU|nr:ABC transporter permease [Kibdelosporangium phytohabitans]ALG12458.1 multidrug ABC transporter permease [Kibdelosporangium phytohabitans]MBE1464051.1 ABC-type multidrug transport system permease subunit [Kibdelosporangium phytohabitans]